MLSGWAFSWAHPGPRQHTQTALARSQQRVGRVRKCTALAATGWDAGRPAGQAGRSGRQRRSERKWTAQQHCWLRNWFDLNPFWMITNHFLPQFEFDSNHFQRFVIRESNLKKEWMICGLIHFFHDLRPVLLWTAMNELSWTSLRPVVQFSVLFVHWKNPLIATHSIIWSFFTCLLHLSLLIHSQPSVAVPSLLISLLVLFFTDLFFVVGKNWTTSELQPKSPKWTTSPAEFALLGLFQSSRFTLQLFQGLQIADIHTPGYPYSWTATVHTLSQWKGDETCVQGGQIVISPNHKQPNNL